MSEEEKKAIEDLKKMCIEVLRDDNLISYDEYSPSEKMTLVDIVLNLIEKLQKELELNNECEIALNNRILDLENELNKEKEKNKELENADLTTVYMSGFYDGEKKWKDKIKSEIDRLNIDIENIKEKSKSAHDYDRSKSRLEAYLKKSEEMVERLKKLLEE